MLLQIKSSKNRRKKLLPKRRACNARLKIKSYEPLQMKKDISAALKQG